MAIESTNTDTGNGPAVLFIPGSYSTPAAWRPIQRLMPPRWRMLSCALLGYGGTHDTRTRADPAIEHEVALVAEVVRRALPPGSPVHLVGHSFGGTVALAVALAHAAAELNVASLALFEANPLDLIAGHAAYADTLAMSRGFEAAVDAGEADAPRHIIDFWGGAGTWAAMPEPVRTFCRGGAHANVIDWACDFAFRPDAKRFAALTCPVLLLRGEHANPAMVAMNDELAKRLPHCSTDVVEGAGHFLVTTHAADCAGRLAAFLDLVSGEAAQG